MKAEAAKRRLAGTGRIGSQLESSLTVVMILMV